MEPLKTLLLTALILSGLFNVNAQELTYENFKSLIPYLKKEDWKSSFAASGKLLAAATGDTSDFHAIIVYIHIFSAAGMVTEGQMTFEELQKNVMPFQGQKIIMAGHPVTTRDGALNQVKFEFDKKPNTAFTSATNAKGSNILCFEEFTFASPIKRKKFPEKSMVRCGGTLKKIETNPNESLIWILRLTVSDAFAKPMN